MNIKNDYNANSIELLTGLQGVRKRPGMYIGSTNSAGLHQLVWEIVANAVDEALNGYGEKVTVTIHKDGSVTVTDEGRGIPCDINKQTGMPAVQLIFTTLHSGAKFNDNAYKSSGGLHGVGSSVVNALSLYCDITVNYDRMQYHIRFSNGGNVEVPLETVGKTLKHGTIVTFKPDPTIFSTTDFKWDVIASHLQEEAFLLKKVHFILNDERVKKTEEFYYENGLSEYLDVLNQSKEKMYQTIDFEDTIDRIHVEVAMQYCKNDYGETIFSYANNVRTKDGGTHESGFKLGLTKAVNDFVTNNDLFKSKDKLDGSDIREGLTAIISVKLPVSICEFEGQTKEKLGTQQALSVVSNLVYTKLTYYLNENKDFAVAFIEKCFASQNARLAARKAKSDARSTSKRLKEAVLVSDKLTPCQGKDYKKNELFIVEGDSAGGSAKKGRFPKFQAILPLRGKPLNTYGLTVDKILKNEEISTIINTIGAGFGQSFDVEDSHYGKIIIMTDADTDGAHIQTLLLTFFYIYMRDLITHGMVYVAVPPLYRVYKSDNKDKIKEQYVWKNEDLEKTKAAIGAGYKINRYKGLGEMNADQLSYTTMNPEHRLLLRISIEDPLLVEKKVNVLMGKNADLRKEWIVDNINFEEVDNFIKEVKK